MRWLNYIVTRKAYRAFQLALTLAKVESGGFFPHSLSALYRGWLIICSSHMLTHDLLLSFSGPVSWDISCFHQPLSFVQQQLACHLAATLLWMCPPFASSCCTWARQSVQILPALSLSFTFVQSVARWIYAHTAFHFMPWILFKLLWSLSLSLPMQWRKLHWGQKRTCTITKQLPLCLTAFCSCSTVFWMFNCCLLTLAYMLSRTSPTPAGSLYSLEQNTGTK